MPRSSTLLALAAVASASVVCACDHGQPTVPAAGDLRSDDRALELDTTEALADGIELYKRARGDQYQRATDANERSESLIHENRFTTLSDEGDFESVFNLGDEAFEGERDVAFGAGLGPAPPPGLPIQPARLQMGEMGGLDSTSCRSCHFVGGPDGSGSRTQAAFFRGDGQNLSTTTVRDAPHIMGLGYIQIIASNMTRLLQQSRDNAINEAAELGEPVTYNLQVEGIPFGRITANPDGTVDTSEVEGVTDDLVVRPLGHKGRHATLVELVDEALQLHHGLQSVSRVATYYGTDDQLTYVGAGPEWDPDDDSRSHETSWAQALLLSSYMSMLPIPVIRPPDDPVLALAWARGKARFDEIGCGGCHTSERLLPRFVVEHHAVGGYDYGVQIDLEEHGEDPKPARADFGEGRQGLVIFPFTDLKRHDMGPELAEDADEALPDGSDVIPASVFLTRSLWGLADTAPYLHDGRAPTVHDAILAHGGESQDARDAYAALSEREQGEIRAFLMSLTRPPVVLVE